MQGERPIEKRVAVNGISLAYFQWCQQHEGRDPTILLAHATGFHARCWDQIVRHLASIHGSERHVIAPDLRGHGRSSNVEITNWKVVGEDLAAFVEQLDLRELIAVGHSMGGHAIVDAAAACPDRFERLVLIDPIINAPQTSPGKISKAGPDEQHPAAKRKRYFESPEAMFERFKDRHPFSLFDPAVLRDYCNYGLLPTTDGTGFELACPPEIEAGIYMAMGRNVGIYSSVRSLDIPVLILRPIDPAPNPARESSTWHELVHQFKQGEEIHIRDRTHFLPMEAPAQVAELILKQPSV